jgi:hypothetical protein
MSKYLHGCPLFLDMFYFCDLCQLFWRFNYISMHRITFTSKIEKQNYNQEASGEAGKTDTPTKSTNWAQRNWKKCDMSSEKELEKKNNDAGAKKR